MGNANEETPATSATTADLEKLEASLEQFIVDNRGTTEPAENFQRSMKGSEGWFAKSRRILEIAGTVGGLVTPTVLIFNSWRSRRAARRAEAMDFVNVPTNGSDSIAINL